MNTTLPLIVSLTILCSQAMFGQVRYYPAEKIPQILVNAESYYGTSYCYGGNGPRCFDCSGFVKKIFNEAGIMDIPRTSSDQYYGYNKGRTFHGKAKLSKLQEGDLVYFDTPGPRTHIGMVVANKKGKIQFVHAASKGVRYDFITGYWYQHYIGARRVFEPFSENLEEEFEVDFEEIVMEDEDPSQSNEVKMDLPPINSYPQKPKITPKGVTLVKGEYPEGSKRKLSYSDVKEMGPCEMKIMKNEIFARHGYKFYKNPCMVSLFNSKDYRWYDDVPKKKNPQHYFSQIEKANVALLLKYEGQCYCE